MRKPAPQQQKMPSSLESLGTGDTIMAGDGDNVVIAGQGEDTVTAGSGKDVVLGDSGEALFISGLIVSAVSTAPGEGGDDDIIAGEGDDVVIGGTGSDYVNVDRVTGDPVGTDIGADVILGDNGIALFDATGSSSVLIHIETADPTLDSSGELVDHDISRIFPIRKKFIEDLESLSFWKT